MRVAIAMPEIAHHPFAGDHHVAYQRHVAGEQETVQRVVRFARGKQGRILVQHQQVGARADAERSAARPPAVPPASAARHSVSPTLGAVLRARRCCDGAWSVAGHIPASATPPPARRKCANPNRCRARRPHRDSVQRKQAVAEIGLGGRTQTGHGAGLGDAARSRLRQMGRVHQAPARIDVGVIEQPVAPAARRARRGSPAPRRSARRYGCGSARFARARRCQHFAHGGFRHRAQRMQSDADRAASATLCARSRSSKAQVGLDSRGRNGAGARASGRPSKPPVMYSTGNSVRPMPASRAASINASDIAAGSAYGVPSGCVMQVVEFADLRVARLQHLDVKLRRNRVQIVRADARGERVHRFAPASRNCRRCDPLRSASPAIARWKACECRFGMPGSTKRGLSASVSSRAMSAMRLSAMRTRALRSQPCGVQKCPAWKSVACMLRAG